MAEPGAFVDNLAAPGEPGLAGELDPHLTPGPMAFVHAIDLPVAFSGHHPAGPDAAHEVGDVGIGVRTLPVGTPVLKMQCVVKACEIRLAGQSWRPDHLSFIVSSARRVGPLHPVAPRCVALRASLGRRALVGDLTAGEALSIEGVEIIHTANAGDVFINFEGLVGCDHLRVETFIEGAVGIRLQNIFSCTESYSFIRSSPLTD